jgi:hypothetical protein
VHNTTDAWRVQHYQQYKLFFRKELPSQKPAACARPPEYFPKVNLKGGE